VAARPTKGTRKAAGKPAAFSYAPKNETARADEAIRRSTIQDKEARAAAMLRRTAQPISEKQWGLLANLLLTGNRVTLVRFIEWANDMPSDAGTLNRWDKTRVWLSRRYMVEAINMAKHDVNSHGTAWELLAANFGLSEEEFQGAVTEVFDFEFADLPPLPV